MLPAHLTASYNCNKAGEQSSPANAGTSHPATSLGTPARAFRCASTKPTNQVPIMRAQGHCAATVRRPTGFHEWASWGIEYIIAEPKIIAVVCAALARGVFVKGVRCGLSPPCLGQPLDRCLYACRFTAVRVITVDSWLAAILASGTPSVQPGRVQAPSSQPPGKLAYACPTPDQWLAFLVVALAVGADRLPRPATCAKAEPKKKSVQSDLSENGRRA